MASTDARPFPIKNVAFRVTFNILDNDGDPVTGATGLDSEISKDAGAFTDLGDEAHEIGTSGMYYLDITNTEMNADTVAIQVKTTSTDAKTTQMVFYPLSIPEPTAAPAWPTDLLSALAQLLAWRANKVTQTATTTTLRNAADNGTLYTSTTSDDGTTFTKGKAT